MRRWLVFASLTLACGDNVESRGPALAPTAELVVVAHPSDDLLFMQPDLLEAVQRGTGVTTVFLRARADQADAGELAAYAHAIGSDDWQCGAITIAEQAAFHCRQAGPNVSLVFLAQPEVSTLIGIIRETEPSTIRTLEVTGTHGDDDPEHTDAGRRTLVALAATNRAATIVAYRGLGVAGEPPNKLPAVFETAVEMLARYEACTTGCAACGDACTAIDQEHVDWLLRRYAVGFRRTAGGRLRIGNQCVTAALTMTSCPASPVWVLDGAGELRAGDACLALNAGGQLTTSQCLGGVERRWFVDDDGHVMSADGELRCLAAIEGMAVAAPCTAVEFPVWELVPDTVVTPRTTLGIAATGRDVRLGDVTGDGRADLCAVEATGLLCAAGTGLGTFTTASRIDAVSAPLAIDSRSLVLGDIDGDGTTDACGRDDDGILCATAASTFQAVRWSDAFGATDALPTTSASLTVIDANATVPAELCGHGVQGLTCVSTTTVLDGALRSTWPQPTDVVWFADLDGDQQADWCAATDTGPACAVWAQRELTTDGAAWGYSQSGVVDVTAATTATVALSDIDRDGRADLCSLRDDRIVCARSQGHGFGPRSTLAILPNQTTASALWLGDLDGDGRADPCVDAGTSIICARQP